MTDEKRGGTSGARGAAGPGGTQGTQGTPGTPTRRPGTGAPVPGAAAGGRPASSATTRTGQSTDPNDQSTGPSGTQGGAGGAAVSRVAQAAANRQAGITPAGGPTVAQARTAPLTGTQRATPERVTSALANQPTRAGGLQRGVTLRAKDRNKAARIVEQQMRDDPDAGARAVRELEEKVQREDEGRAEELVSVGDSAVAVPSAEDRDPDEEQGQQDETRPGAARTAERVTADDTDATEER